MSEATPPDHPRNQATYLLCPFLRRCVKQWERLTRSSAFYRNVSEVEGWREFFRLPKNMLTKRSVSYLLLDMFTQWEQACEQNTRHAAR